MNSEQIAGVDPGRVNKLELIERLADDLAHEIKNPLHSMVINLEVLRRRISRAGAENLDEQLRSVEVLVSELERVNRNVELLLQLVRPDRGSETTTLVGLIHDYQELIALECERRGVSLELEPGPSLARGRVTRDPTSQAVLNLLLDGIDRTPVGGRLRVRIEDVDGWARLHVRPTEGPEGGNGQPSAQPDPRRMVLTRALSEGLGGRLDEADPEPGAARDGGNFVPAFVLSFPVSAS